MKTPSKTVIKIPFIDDDVDYNYLKEKSKLYKVKDRKEEYQVYIPSKSFCF